MEVVTTTAELSALMRELAQDSFVTVDTEFMREQTFWPDLCLIQIAGETHQAVIDPKAPDIDLGSFFALMANEKVLKVFHAARQDIETFVYLAGAIPHPIFDTQVAAMVCGFGDQVSYESLVRQLAHAQIDKSSRFTDWSRRPLSDKQLAYALSDVTHLRAVYQKLKAELDKTGREPWLAQEMSVLTSPGTYNTAPEAAWKRLKVRLRSKKQLGALIALAAWREREAQEKNVPRQRILKDDALTEIATQMPQTREALNGLRALPRGFGNSRSGEAILQAVKDGLAADAKGLPPLPGVYEKIPDSAQAAAEVLKLALKIVCERQGLAPRLVASSADIDALAQDDDADVPVMKGWRRETFGNLALDIKHGRALIGFRDGRAQIIRAAATAPRTEAAE
ncbi:MAG: ribonuclease D [Parvibaculaceae bacterium]|jgi:ribonuclease D